MGTIVRSIGYLKPATIKIKPNPKDNIDIQINENNISGKSTTNHVSLIIEYPITIKKKTIPRQSISKIVLVIIVSIGLTLL